MARYPSKRAYHSSTFTAVALGLSTFQLTAAHAEQSATANDAIVVVAHRRADDAITVTARRDRDEIRLKTVAYRLEVNNADRCERPRMMTGLVVHDLSYYDLDVRSHFAKLYELTYGFAVLAVVPGSVASTAGLRAGDQITGVNGEDLRHFHEIESRKSGYFERTGSFENSLSLALNSGPVVLTVQRDDNDLQVQLRGQPGCGGQVRIEEKLDSDDVDLNRNAWYDGFSIGISKHLVDFARSDDELAFIVAHEAAHNIAGDFFGVVKEKRYSHLGMNAKDAHKSEIAADVYAVDMVARTIYKPAASMDFISRAAQARWLDQSATHPTVTERITIISKAIDEFKPKIAEAN